MNKLSAQVQQQHSDLQALLNEETQKVKNLQLELDAKESEIEHLAQKMAFNGGDASLIHSGNELDLDDTELGLLFVTWWPFILLQNVGAIFDFNRFPDFFAGKLHLLFGILHPITVVSGLRQCFDAVGRAAGRASGL